jgi:hypothetical protein
MIKNNGHLYVLYSLQYRAKLVSENNIYRKKEPCSKNLIVSKGIITEAGHGLLVFSPNAILLRKLCCRPMKTKNLASLPLHFSMVIGAFIP